MTKLDEQAFLDKLYEVVNKLAGISKTQSYRFKKEWEENLQEFSQEPHLVRQIQVEKDKFLKNIDYRINVLNEVIHSFEDGFHTIKTLLTTLYQFYFNDSKKFYNDFSEYDRKVLKYYVAKKILGDLIQYNQMDHESVPIKYNLVAKNYTMMKLKGLSEKDIQENLKKIVKLNLPEIRKILKEVITDGIIKKKKKNYITDKELELTDAGNKKYNQTIRSLVEWPTLFWRSFYNIRELNVTVEGNSKNLDFLNKILEKAATQGYVASHYVFQNLVKFYEKNKAEMK